MRRGGAYFRVCDPAWMDPSDTRPSQRVGGRWNPPDRPGRPGFGALYLNQSLAASRENARRYIRLRAGAAATFDDIAPSALPDLQHYTVAEADFVDAVTTDGIAELGLAATYPTAIPHPPCQGIAEAAYADGDPGIAVLSAVASTEEELVIFDHAVPPLAAKGARDKFADWF